MKVEVKDYLKVIKGKTILDHVNYSFTGGKIYGLYGRNGSGKTMLMRAIAGLIYPTQGQILIDEKQLHKDISFPENTGIIIENMELMPRYGYKRSIKKSRFGKCWKKESKSVFPWNETKTFHCPGNF